MVLDDALLIAYEQFKKQGEAGSDTNLMLNFFRYYRFPHLTNHAQIMRCETELGECAASLKIAAANKGIAASKLSLNELSQQTKLKLILTNESDPSKQKFPYLNINNKQVDTPFSITIPRGGSRQQLIEYLNNLCSDARSITLHDAYFMNKWQNTQKLFYDIIPKKILTIYHPDKFTQANVSAIKCICSEWTVKKDTQSYDKNNHDRYLKIDNELEIIVSSGFDYLWDTSKEITCIFKVID